MLVRNDNSCVLEVESRNQRTVLTYFPYYRLCPAAGDEPVHLDILPL